MSAVSAIPCAGQTLLFGIHAVEADLAPEPHNLATQLTIPVDEQRRQILVGIVRDALRLSSSVAAPRTWSPMMLTNFVLGCFCARSSRYPDRSWHVSILLSIAASRWSRTLACTGNTQRPCPRAASSGRCWAPCSRPSPRGCSPGARSDTRCRIARRAASPHTRACADRGCVAICAPHRRSQSRAPRRAH